MRVVLIVCGTLAVAITLGAGWAACHEARSPSPSIATQAPRRADESASFEPAVVPRPGISLGAFSVGDVRGPNGYSTTPRPMDAAVFPADAGAAITLVTCNGECELDVPAGRYDLCLGGSLSCKRAHPRDELDVWCNPATEKGCQCMTPPGARSEWKGPCQQVEVSDHVVRVVASSGAFGATTFRCFPPGDVCR